jgi:transcriptional regulator with XRE-family HTH domain
MPRNPSPAFSVVLDKLMDARGLHNAALARELDVSPTQVSRWRRGLEIPSIGRIESIANYFGVDRDFLERLAGWRDNTVSGAHDTIDPEIAAMLDADRAEVAARMRGIPSKFWPVIMAAQRNVRNVLFDSLEDAGISNAFDAEIAPLPGHTGQDDEGSSEPPNNPLARALQAAGAY